MSKGQVFELPRIVVLIALFLLCVNGINTGFVGLFEWNPLEGMLDSNFQKILWITMGVCAIALFWTIYEDSVNGGGIGSAACKSIHKKKKRKDTDSEGSASALFDKVAQHLG
jgi:uncharacterized membrane protein YuzA (DUF378 family)